MMPYLYIFITSFRNKILKERKFAKQTSKLKRYFHIFRLFAVQAVLDSKRSHVSTVYMKANGIQVTGKSQ